MRLRTGVVGVLVACTWAPSLARAQDKSRAVIGVFPIRASKVPAVGDDAIEEATTALHGVIATESGFLTVPRAVIRKALAQGSQGGDAPSDDKVAELEAIARQRAAEAKEAKVQVPALEAAIEVALEGTEAEAVAALEKAKAEVARTQEAAEAAARAVQETRALLKAAQGGGTCTDEDCQVAVGKKVGASKVARANFTPADKGCRFTVRFLDVDALIDDLSISADAACDPPGLLSAIKQVGAALRIRRDAGYEVYKQDLAEGAAIRNPPSDKSASLTISAAAKGDKNEQIEVWINGEKKGALAAGLFEATLPLGRYIVVLKPVSELFAPRRFDVNLKETGARVPRFGSTSLEPVFAQVQFDLVPGPWTLRSGPSSLVEREANSVRPGKVPVQLYLSGRPVGEVSLDLKPGETQVIRIVERPRTEEELSGSTLFWNVRKYGAIAVAAGVLAFGTERLVAANSAASQRDDLRQQLSSATVPGTYNDLRSRLVLEDDRRGDAQVVATGLLIGGGVAALWAAAEWIWGRPDEGRIVAEGHEVTPITWTQGAEEEDDKIPTRDEPGSAK